MVPGEILERGVGPKPGSTIPPGEPVRATFRYYPYVKYHYAVCDVKAERGIPTGRWGERDRWGWRGRRTG